jgi:hypothetical protein
MEQAIAALEGIQRYGLDTLSGRTDGPDDRGWQRAGVNEMTKRARLGIAPLRAALAEPAPVQEPSAWLPMDTAPKDGTHVFLLVEFEDHAMEDAPGPHLTIGSNTSENDGGPDEWQFAGWNWEHDCYTQGVGNPVGWLPMTVLQLKEHQDTETVRQKVGLT